MRIAARGFVALGLAVAHHNAGYRAQLIDDSLASLGERVPVAMGGKVRP
jgi:hypothetical protein